MTRLDRQSFLGAESDRVLRDATLGIVGLGGGGSHVVQQAAHLGIGGFVIVDPQSIDFTNTNRLVGGTLLDVDSELAKVAIAERMILGMQPSARVRSICDSWHQAAEELKNVDIIVGAVDSFTVREELERFARRYLIPYIDIGMDVHERGSEFWVCGQVILSSPGRACLRCCGLITDQRLEQEANRYGAAGGRPQVIWPNAMLAASAIGLVTQLLTPWYRNPPAFVYLEYDGNLGIVRQSPCMEAFKSVRCVHHPVDETGDPTFDIRAYAQARSKSPASDPSLMSRLRAFLQRLRA